ncbi:MAG: hypothetical protein WC728_17290 [Elusimicrobiota bacterium]
MAMLNVLEMDRLYQNEWVVLDRSLKVVDHGPDLSLLRARYGESPSRYTLYYVASSCDSRMPLGALAR